MANKKNSNENYGIRERTHDGVDKIMDRAESMRERSNEVMSDLKEKAILKRENVDGYIRKNPEKSVLIAVGIGAVVGGIITMVLMKRKN